MIEAIVIKRWNGCWSQRR